MAFLIADGIENLSFFFSVRYLSRLVSLPPGCLSRPLLRSATKL